jgi:hypothetical protein
MRDWNVVVSVYQEGFRRVLSALRQLAPTERSDYYNVLIMKADHRTENRREHRAL